MLPWAKRNSSLQARAKMIRGAAQLASIWRNRFLLMSNLKALHSHELSLLSKHNKLTYLLNQLLKALKPNLLR